MMRTVARFGAAVGLLFTSVADVSAQGETTVIAAGNIGDCDSEGDEATARLVETLDGTVLALGDNVYPMGTAENYEACYGPTWGQFLDRTRVVPGNHDYGPGNADAFFAYFGERAGEDERGYYSFEIGTWHVIGLNSVCDEVPCGGGSAQLEWLEDDLAATEASCILAYWHHPRFSSGTVVGSDASMESAWRTLDDAGAEVILTAHSHHYERFALQDHRGTPDPDGVRQFVVGTGGTVLHEVGTRLLNSEFATADHHGVLKLDLLENEYGWEFVAADGSIVDSGRQECGEPPLDLRSLVGMLAPALIVVPLLILLLAVVLFRSEEFQVR